MLTVTDRFLAALRETHTIAVAAFLYQPGSTTPINVPVVGGSLTADADARSRRQATIDLAFSLADPLTPDVVRTLPFGGEAVIERGIRYADGAGERVKLGRFRVDAVTWAEDQGTASLTLNDRMTQVADEPFLTPWIPAGLKPTNAIKLAVQQVFPSIAFHVTTDPATETALGDATVYDQDRAAAISDLAASIEAEAFFDNLGDFVIRPQPDGSGDPVWSVDAGPRGVMIGATESLDRSSIKNGVAVRAQANPDEPPIFSLAVDTDPASPTLWGGPFGKVAMIVNLTSVSSQAQADSTANSLLNLRLGLARTLALTGVPNPALEPGDLISIEHADGRTETQLINAISLGLDVEGALGLTTKAHYRPAGIGSLQAGRRIFTGQTAWQELADAEVEAA